MKTVFFLVLLLQTIPAQQDSLLRSCLDKTASELTKPLQNPETFFGRFFPENSGNVSAALVTDTAETYYFDISFSSPPDYTLASKTISVNFNYLIADKKCSGSNRNGVLIKEIVERKGATKKQPEIINIQSYVLIPDKCTTTRFYNSKKEMFCDNKRQFPMEYEEGKKTAENLKVRVGIMLLGSSTGDYYEKNIPAEPNHPVERHIKEYVLRCCIRSITFLKGDEILDSFVSLK